MAKKIKNIDDARLWWPFCPRCGKSYPQPSQYACRDCRAVELDWIHNRPLVPTDPPIPIEFYVDLHMGFLSVEETEEHLIRLNRSYDLESKSEVGFSKIEKSDSRKPTPIDRTAHRVAPKPEDLA